MEKKAILKVNEATLRDRSPSLFQFNDKLLKDPNRLYQFKKFVETEYADEHLSFYLEVEEWKRLKSANAKKAKGQEIIDLYIAPGANKQINIEAKQLKEILAQWEAGTVDGVFDQAHTEVFKLMKLDSYQRFSRSVFFQAMLAGSEVQTAFPEEIFLQFMELCTGRDQDWKLVKKKGEVEAWEHGEKGKDSQLLKATCVVRGDTASVEKVLRDPQQRVKWDKECVGCYEVERFSEAFTTIYTARKGARGADSTDVIVAQVARTFSDGTVCIISRSLPNGTDVVPAKKGFTRLHMETGGWMLETIPESTRQTKVTWVQQIQYGGDVGKKMLESAKQSMFALIGLREYMVALQKNNRQSGNF